MDFKYRKKAEKVRKLNKDNKIKEANFISSKIGEYLQERYPYDFALHFHTFTNKEERRIRDLENKTQIINYLKTSTKYLRNLGFADIVIFSYFDEDDNLVKPLFTYFQSDVEPFDEDDTYLPMPNSFYKFLEELGLTLNIANKLYNLKSYRYKECDYLFPEKIAEYDDLWPNNT